MLHFLWTRKIAKAVLRIRGFCILWLHNLYELPIKCLEIPHQAFHEIVLLKLSIRKPKKYQLFYIEGEANEVEVIELEEKGKIEFELTINSTLAISFDTLPGSISSHTMKVSAMLKQGPVILPIGLGIGSTHKFLSAERATHLGCLIRTDCSNQKKKSNWLWAFCPECQWWNSVELWYVSQFFCFFFFFSLHPTIWEGTFMAGLGPRWGLPDLTLPI